MPCGLCLREWSACCRQSVRNWIYVGVTETQSCRNHVSPPPPGRPACVLWHVFAARAGGKGKYQGCVTREGHRIEGGKLGGV